MIKTRKIYLAAAMALTLTLTGCSNDSGDQAQKSATTPSSQVTAGQQTMQAGTPVSDTALTGTVVETFDSGGYTYIHLDNGEKKIWVAMGQTKVETGQEISLGNGPVMKDFHSPSLNRTFDEIVFSSGLADGAATNPHAGMDLSGASVEESFSDALSAGGGAPNMDAVAASGGSTKAVVTPQEIQVAKAEGDNGRTVEEVFAQADDLNGQKVTVRGKVVKVSPQIMGTNWLHIQDGTGTPSDKSHDLVVTTDEMANEGDIVLIEGTVAAKKDFGMGYFYEALVEKAVISK
ncbi:MAG: DNA-binding protein [Desulfobulbaceae bacterium]|nr:MAG: DNA-binding protein [Desulfobulbaceae bacterium]